MPDTPLVPGEAAALAETVAGLRAANARPRELIAERDELIAELRVQVAESGELREQVEQLRREVADLAARVKQNSKNSSRPPSSDGLGKPAPKSLRKKTGRKPGRPKGQPGATMSLTDHPDHVIRHEPGCCGSCGAGLGGARVTGMERRQVTEIPPVKAEVTEHQMIERECPGCGARAKGRAPDGVNAPVRYGPRAAAMATYLWHGQFLSRDRAAAALGEMFGCAPSPGVIAAMTAKVAGIIAPAIDAIVKALIAADVAHFDETGFRVAGRLAWVHSASSGKYVLVTVHGKRGRQGMVDAEVLEKHGRWFRDAADAGIVLNAARRSNLQKKRHALATRIRDRADDYLRFAHDLRVPADNNEAEQVIRMSKLRIKVSGCMRSMHGAETFCAIRSNLATATRHGIGWLNVLTRAAQGHPWIPGTT